MMPQVASQVELAPVTVHLEPVVHLSLDEFYEFCQLNRELRIERTAAGELVIMPLTGGASGNRNAEITFQLQRWAREDGTGVAFDSSTAFVLPNGAVRSPDASWVRRERLARLSEEEKQKFLLLCPDFVVELRSPSDPPPLLAAKMREYGDNGARLGLLIDPLERRVEVYREGGRVETLEAPATVSGTPVLPGFSLALDAIWSLHW
jgi:Uma2 family endonuclease